MRRRIRLTGRKQLGRASAVLKVAAVSDKRLLSLSIADPKAYSDFPRDSRVVVRLVENKLVELAQFGTLGTQRVVTELRNRAFVAPSCQIRIVASDGEKRGLLLGSTDTWTLRTDGNDGTQQGILLFQPADIAPRAWKLEIRDTDYPIVYLDKRIPNSSTWAKTDPTFISAVLPTIIAQVFDDILEQAEQPDVSWMVDWLQWASVLMPGQKPPFDGLMQDRRQWIECLIDTFCQRHRVSDRLVKALHSEGATQ